MEYSEIKELYHHGIKGQKWGVRRFQNEDGSLTPAGKKRYESQKAILTGVSDIANKSSEMLRSNTGSKRVSKNYSNLTDEELRKRVNRLNLERQYGELTGDTKYVMTGKEKTREILQTIGSVAGIAATSVGVALAIKQLKG